LIDPAFASRFFESIAPIDPARRSAIAADDVHVGLLAGEPREMDDLQRVLTSAPEFSRLVMGVPAGPAEAQSTWSGLPEGKGYDDKFVFGVYAGDEMVGCADVIRAFPDATTAHIGLLLIVEAYQGRGLGAAAYRIIESYARDWPGCLRMRTGVVRTNARVLPFWHAMGFAETGETKPYRYSRIESEIVILAKRIAP
jgi:RimJ/RimL family protein N-acetyltransferase